MDAGLTDLTWSSGISNSVKPQTSGTPISHLIFQFNSGSSGKPTGSAGTSNNTYTVSFGNSGKTQVMVLDGGTKGIEMASPTNGAKGKLEVIFGGVGYDPNRQFHLNLSKSAGDFSFKGNIVIQAGKGNPRDANKNSTFVGDFGKKVEGSITIDGNSTNGWNQSGHRTNLTFTNDAGLEGSLTTKAGTTTATFARGNITGSVAANNIYGAFSNATNIIKFNGRDNKITGNVTAEGGGWQNSLGKNDITFEGNGAISGNVSAASGLGSNSRAINTITFAKGGTIGGNITNNAGINTITATGQTLTIGSGSSKIEVNGGGVATNTFSARDLNVKVNNITVINLLNSTNNNILQATNNLTLTADTIEVKYVDNSGTNTKNTNNTITAGGKATITAGTIKATYGTNSITAKDLNLGVDTLEANGTKDDISITNNEIVVRGHGELEVKHIKAASASNKFTFKDGGYSSLTIYNELKAENGFNTFSIENAGLMFNLNGTATTTAYNNGQNTILLKQGGKFLTTNNKLSFQNLVFDGVKFDENQIGQNTLAQSNAIVDLATGGRDLLDLEKRNSFRLLSIGENADDKGLVGSNGFFRVYANLNKAAGNTLGGVNASGSTNDTYGFAYSDRVVVHKTSNANSSTSTPALTTQYIQVLFDKDTDLSKIAYSGGDTTKEGNIAIFTTKNSTITDADGKPIPLVSLKAVDSVLGFEQVQTDITSKTTDEFGKAPTSNPSNPADTYTTYFLTSAKNQGVSLANQKTSASALGNNYMLYLANLNSLNKRMGELRENTHTHGTWARVFNGMQSTNFSNALDTRSIYTTLQGGYDYSFGFKGASNILGFALSYANSISKSGVTKELDGSEKGIKHAFSNAIEFAIYNAYVQDGASRATGWKNGLYTDSIVKFSYISSDLNLFGEGNNKTTNLAFTLSQEIGYRFLLGNDREFYIDPQGEITLGYLNQSHLKQTLAGHNLTGVQDSILTLRSRIGSSYGYKFDKFTQNKGFNSSLYLGTYFVSDFIVGGDVHLVSTSNQALSLSPLASTARFVLNLGTNFKIKDNTRIYFDFERSFGGKITTDYQLNLGVRYSFGTSKYTPYTEANTQEIKDSNTLKEVEPTKGYYIEVLEKEANKLSSKEKKVLEKLKDNLKVQSKTQGNKTMKVYLVGAFKDEAKAKEAKSKLEGVIKELKGKGSILEVE